MTVVSLERFQAERNRHSVPKPAEGPAAAITLAEALELCRFPGPARETLTRRQLQHRWRMLTHLRNAR